MFYLEIITLTQLYPKKIEKPKHLKVANNTKNVRDQILNLICISDTDISDIREMLWCSMQVSFQENFHSDEKHFLVCSELSVLA